MLMLASSLTFAQQTISFETAEGFALGTLNAQNKWEITEGSDGFLENQVITDEKASEGKFSFKNAYEPDFDSQWFPIFGASKTFDDPADYKNFSITYDVQVTEKLGADFEFTLFAIDENEEFVPVAGVGIENRGMIYLTTSIDYDFDYAEATWEPNTWIKVKIEVSADDVKYYVNGDLQKTITNFTKLNIVGLNMLHNNYGGTAYYDNIVITGGNLSTKPFVQNAVSVYPNPAINNISLNIPAGKEIAKATIYNIAGQKVLSTTQNQNIDISNLAKGAYFVKTTTTTGEQFTAKIIKN